MIDLSWLRSSVRGQSQSTAFPFFARISKFITFKCIVPELILRALSNLNKGRCIPDHCFCQHIQECLLWKPQFLKHLLIQKVSVSFQARLDYSSLPKVQSPSLVGQNLVVVFTCRAYLACLSNSEYAEDQVNNYATLYMY